MGQKSKNEPSLKPIQICHGAWYYENGGSIDVIVETTHQTQQVRIPSRKLVDTLRRQGYTVTRARIT